MGILCSAEVRVQEDMIGIEIENFRVVDAIFEAATAYDEGLRRRIGRDSSVYFGFKA
jgi:hypothetical protein